MRAIVNIVIVTTRLGFLYPQVLVLTLSYALQLFSQLASASILPRFH